MTTKFNLQQTCISILHDNYSFVDITYKLSNENVVDNILDIIKREVYCFMFNQKKRSANCHKVNTELNHTM